MANDRHAPMDRSRRRRIAAEPGAGNVRVAPRISSPPKPAAKIHGFDFMRFQIDSKKILFSTPDTG
jgi:hypothetical protein